jgi:cell division septal protein FtsQ
MQRRVKVRAKAKPKIKITPRKKTLEKQRRRNMVALFFLCLIVFGYLSFPKILNLLENYRKPNWMISRIDSVQIKGISDNQTKDIQDFIKIVPGTLYKDVDTAKLEVKLKDNFSWIRNAYALKSRIFKKLKIRIEPRNPIAIVTFIQNGKTGLLDENGDIFNAADFEPKTDLLKLELNSKDNQKKLSPKTISFIAGFIELSKKLDAKVSVMKYSTITKRAEIVLQDDTRILWGNFEYPHEKIDRINQILKKAKAALLMPGPYEINLEYFEQGKAYLSQLK